MPAIDLTPPLICDEMMLPALPTLPTGVSLAVQIPGFGDVFSARLCCKIFQIPLGIPPIDLGISVQIPLLVAIDTLIAALNQYRVLLPMRCPRE